MNPLQRDLRPGQLIRNVDTIYRAFAEVGYHLFSEMCRASNGKTGPITVLDVGCGAGVGIESLVITLQREFPQPLRGIGMDLTPLPNYAGLPYSQRRTRLVAGDAVRLPLRTESIDFGYSVCTFAYIPDKLKAMEESYRVLTPGGRFLWETSGLDSAYPILPEIMKATEGSSVFEVREEAVLCKKGAHDSFKGFPFELVGSLQPTKKSDLFTENLHFRGSVYRAGEGLVSAAAQIVIANMIRKGWKFDPATELTKE